MLLVFAWALDRWLDALLVALTRLAPDGSPLSYSYNLYALLALILVSLSCGAVGSLVVGARMAFFSDALAHCAFASVSIGFVVFALVMPRSDSRDQFWNLVTPIMLAFGACIGVGIAAVRERTGLSSDTVIGVFFAAALGLAAMLRKIMQSRQLFVLEDFLFGDPVRVRPVEILWLAGLVLLVVVVLSLIYNPLLLHGFSSSLALSRNVPSRLANYLFIVLLAIVVNLCVRTVGVLLINALLVVPAATAANVSRNLRQLFWLSIILCLVSSVAGQLLCWEIEAQLHAELGTPGTVILLGVGLFILSAVFGLRFRDRADKEGDRPTVSAPGP